jgi:hypothetical protein
MARASVALRGTGVFWTALEPGPFMPLLGVAESRATVTRGLNNSHWLAWSLAAMRTGTGFRH